MSSHEISDLERKVRVAVLGVKYFPSKGGTSRLVEDVLESLADRFEFVLYCYRHEGAKSRLPGVSIVELPEFPGGSLGVFFYYMACGIHLMWRRNVDIVHVHKIDAAPLLPLLTRRFPCIATSHESPYRRDKWSRFARFYFRWAERIFLQSSARLTCVSRSLCASYQKRSGRSVDFIGNGLRGDLALDDSGAQALLERNGVHGDFILFAARRVMRTKGAHTLLEASWQVPNVAPIVLVGDFTQVPPYTRRLHSLSELEGATASKQAGFESAPEVHFIDPVNRETLMALLRRARLFVFPSESEGMSVMLLEAAKMRTPIVASAIPENVDVLQEDEALFFESGNATDLAQRLAWAQTHPSEMAVRAEKARKRVESDYGIASVGLRYAKLYESASTNAQR